MHEIVPFRHPEVWVHYSDKSDEIGLYSREQSEIRMPYQKPSGLWITPEHAETNWYDWATENNFGDLEFIHDVRLNSNARLLRLDSAEDIDRFTDEFGESSSFEHLKSVFREPCINWKKVAERYQGILIPRYIWERRMNFRTMWYYPWDCASGCIWDVDAIESIECRGETVRDGV